MLIPINKCWCPAKFHPLQVPRLQLQKSAQPILPIMEEMLLGTSNTGHWYAGMQEPLWCAQKLSTNSCHVATCHMALIWMDFVFVASFVPWWLYPREPCVQTSGFCSDQAVSHSFWFWLKLPQLLSASLLISFTVIPFHAFNPFPPCHSHPIIPMPLCFTVSPLATKMQWIWSHSTPRMPVSATALLWCCLFLRWLSTSESGQTLQTFLESACNVLDNKESYPKTSAEQYPESLFLGARLRYGPKSIGPVQGTALPKYWSGWFMVNGSGARPIQIFIRRVENQFSKLHNWWQTTVRLTLTESERLAQFCRWYFSQTNWPFKMNINSAVECTASVSGAKPYMHSCRTVHVTTSVWFSSGSDPWHRHRTTAISSYVILTVTLMRLLWCGRGTHRESEAHCNCNWLSLFSVGCRATSTAHPLHTGCI